MPNTSVRAAAEGMPTLNRRTALAVTSAGIVSAITVLSTPAKAVPAEASPVSTKLLALIDAKHAAYARFEEAIERATPWKRNTCRRQPSFMFRCRSGAGNRTASDIPNWSAWKMICAPTSSAATPNRRTS